MQFINIFDEERAGRENGHEKVCRVRLITPPESPFWVRF